MDWELAFYMMAHSIGIIVSLGVTRYVWRHRSVPGAGYFAWYQLAAVLWSLCSILGSASANPALQVFWGMVGGIGVYVMPVMWLAFALKYTGRGKWLTKRTWILVSIEPGIAILMMESYAVGSLIRSARGLDVVSPGPLMAIVQGITNVYVSLLLLIGTLFIIQELVRAPRMYRRQYFSLLIGTWAPWAFGVLALWGVDPFPVELLPFGYAIGGLVATWGIFRYQVFDIMPIALDTVIESISDGVIVLDTRHRIVDLNPAAQRMTGLSAAQVAGLPISQALSDWKDLLHCLDEGQTQAEITRGKPVPGKAEGGQSETYYELHISPLYNRQEALSGWLILLYDLTVHKQADEALRESEEKFRAMSASAQDAVIMLDNEGLISFWNKAATQLFGYTSQEALGQDVHALIGPKRYYDAFLAGFGKFKTTGKGAAVGKTLELAALRKDGSEFPVELSLSAVKLQGQWCSTAIIRDITERKRAEEALRRAKEVALEAQRVAEEAQRAAEEAQKAAEAASRAKSVFLANMSHELRTPLNAILGFSELMGRDPTLTAEQQENLEIIGRSGEHLLALINDVLDLSKIEAGRVVSQEENFDLHRLLDDLEEMFRLRAMERGLSLLFERAPDLPQYVRLDQNKLRQVLINLLSNAVKFTREGGVTLRVGRHRNGKILASTPDSPPPALRLLLHFEVEDTGVGIAPEELDAVFDAFVQTASGQKSKQGTGLGMPISRQFVRMMGGDLVVSSELGKGTIFQFDVRAELADTADLQTAKHRRRVLGLEPGQPVHRLLVVEDRDASRKLLVKILRSCGFQVREATNGQEAVEIWERWEPHLIWMDMRMPVMDGHEATKRIKATTKGQATVIIALTASAFEEERATTLSEGCDDFVRKPFRETEIYAKLAEHLGVRFVYEETREERREERATEDVLTPRALAILPANWVAELYQAAIQADGDLVLGLAEQIRAQHGPVADALASLVGSYRFDVIANVSQEIGV